MNPLRSLLVRLYSLLLRLYPGSFRTSFGEEMQEVYQAVAAEAAQKGALSLLWVSGWELLDLPPNLLREHWSNLGQRWKQKQVHDTSDLSSSWTAAMAGTTLFLVAGLQLVLEEVPQHWPVFAWLPTLRLLLFLSLLMLCAAGFGVGWVKSFPRWSYPYVMLTAMFSLYLLNAATPELRILSDTFGPGDPWGWRAWMSGAILVAVALAVSRSLYPAIRLFANVWDDWTLLTWGMFGTMPLLIATGFDEVDKRYSLPFMLLLTAVMAGTALVYLRSRRAWQQRAVLLGGIFLTVSVVAVAPTWYWLGAGWGSLPGLILGTLVVVAALFSPAFIGLLHSSLDFVRSA